jgi:site-specific recombinase XerD
MMVERRLSLQARREVLAQFLLRYHEASTDQKRLLLDEFAQITGYHRKYAMWLLNHTEQGQQAPARPRPGRYGSEVQQALVLAWQAANRICSKRLMPFLPTLIESLERHGHLHLSASCREQLLSMSAATADRLLRSQRGRGPQGLSTTRAGTLLKQQIPIRTFEQWNETRPGFLEADLVAHCGSQNEGSFLYTLTLTDIATGWTECFPLLSKSAEAVVSVLQQARGCFPFPILGLDTDNGHEFINECLLTYCDAEQITFTRGREGLKNDQCFVEQKNGAIVRQVVGYDRLEGEQAYQQLGEVYQALRLYVNGFQPSMKLQAKQYDGRKARRIYDAAKTPLQRLLLSKVLPASKEHELLRVAQVLDPLRLFHHLQDLQQALLGLATTVSPDVEGAVLPFCIQQCLAGPRAANPENVEASRGEEVIHAGVADPVSSGKREHGADHQTPSACSSPVTPFQHTVEASPLPPQLTSEEEATCRLATMSGIATQDAVLSSNGQPQVSHAPPSLQPSRHIFSALTMEQVVHEYLEDQRNRHRRPKTLEWHRKALSLFLLYLRTEHQCVLLDQITEAQVRGWLVWLPHLPTATGTLRSPGTVASYARSARAFCQWLVRQRSLPATPFAHLPLPQMEHRLFSPLEPGEWEQLLLACRPPKETGVLAEQATARNRAILWVLFDTGMRATEICALRLSDVDREQGIVSVRGKGATVRRLTLGHEGLCHLLAYLDHYRLREAACGARTDEASLFLSETGRPLTKSGITLLFDRLRQRAGITRKGVSPLLLRENFAMRYLQTGGDLRALWELLGQKESTSFQHYLQTSDEGKANEKRKRC